MRRIYSEKAFIETISKAESIANEIVTIEFQSDIHKIKSISISDQHEKELMSKYLANTINGYASSKNIYKACCEEFDFLLSKSNDTVIAESDRHKFIALSLMRYFDYEPQENQSIKARESVLEQINNLESIIVETRVGFLKQKIFLKMLKEIESDVHSDKKKTNYQFTIPEIALYCYLLEIPVERNADVTKISEIEHLLDGRKGSGLYNLKNDIPNRNNILADRGETQNKNFGRKLSKVANLLEKEGFTKEAIVAKAYLRKFVEKFDLDLKL